MTGRPVIPFSVGDVVRLRRRHACGGDLWTVDRLGADIGLRCTMCGRRVLLERTAVERRMAAFVVQCLEATTANDPVRMPDPGTVPDPSGPPA